MVHVQVMNEMNQITSMTGRERELLNALCVRIVDEKNPAVLRRLLIELDALLKTRRGKETEHFAAVVWTKDKSKKHFNRRAD